MLTKTSQKKPDFFECLVCDYTTSKKGNYNAHLMTAKHHSLTSSNKKPAKLATPLVCSFCNKQYQSRPGLWAHSKKCTTRPCCVDVDPVEAVPVESKTNEKIANNTFIMELFKENQEFKNLLLEQCKHAEVQQKQLFELQKENATIMNKMVEITQHQQTLPSTINNNTMHNQFNLNIFLNETCKNAINFTDFIDNIQVTDNDLENNAKMGFVEGVTKIIMDNLKQLELIERPIHCTDAKRETIYVKEEDQWEKDGSKDIIQKGIQEITRKNMCQLSEWRENNPEYNDMETELGEKSIVLQQNLMAGGKRSEFYPKIIKKLAKETILGKKTN
jgi:hypothetical protein